MARHALKPDERRNHERVSLEVEVSMTSENNFYTGFTQDISEGGVFVASHETLPLGTELSFALKLGKGVVHCKGVVRWIREAGPYLQGVPPGMGVMFEDLAPKVQAAINDFIAGRRESIFFCDDPM